jgi:ATP-dependent DNA ligase
VAGGPPRLGAAAAAAGLDGADRRAGPDVASLLTSAFDVLAVDGVDVRTRPWAVRRALLEQLGVDWRPPLQLTPVTFDRDEAEQWSRDYRPLGIEGLVAKGAATRYVPGRASSWLKWKARATEDVIVGAVTGTVERAQAVIAGRLTPDGQLIVVGRSAVLTTAQADQLAAVLTKSTPNRIRVPQPFGGQ